MGIPGLTSFIKSNSDRYLKPFELNDMVVVIDGNSLESNLYSRHMKSGNAFGGDYDVFSHVIRDFFMVLQKCNITPIVIFDGGHEMKKLNTTLKRQNKLMLILQNFNKTHWSGIFYPLFISRVMCDLLHELNIPFVRCFFEADAEIAAVARYFNAPVLSYDSDFFIFDVLYIPFDTIDFKLKESVNGSYITCLIYDPKFFVQQFESLDKDMLPLLPALLGNDYINSKIFTKFFNHVGLPVDQNGRHRHKVISALLHWLKNETLESAVNKILSHIEKKKVYFAIKAVNMCIDDYKSVEPAILPLLRLDGRDKIQEPLLYENHHLIKKLPDRFVQLYQSGRISSIVMDMISLNRYYVPIQVEDVTKESSHMISVPIISAIHKILNAFCDVRTNLLLYIKNKKYYTKYKLTYNVDDCFNGIDISNIISEPREVKVNIIYKVLSLTDSDREAVEKFDKWIIFMIAFVFWIKKSEISSGHFYSIILMVVANYVQTNVGHYWNYQQFMRHKAGEMNRLSKSEISVSDTTGLTFPAMLDSITPLEKLLFTQRFIKLRQYDPEVTSSGYLISTIHLFASFQSALYHILLLNDILDFPLPSIKVHDFYSGTLLYNLHFFLNRKSNSLNFIRDTLSIVPNVMNVFDFIISGLDEYLQQKAKPEKPGRLRPPSCNGRRRKQ